MKAVRRAFSLVELLVVVALIALLAGGVGLALSNGGANALGTAQTTLATMVGTARAQAAVNQTEAILAIYGTRPTAGDARYYLRVMQVFRAEPQGSKTWVPVGNPVELPPGVFVVPPSVSGLLASGVIWPANPPLLSGPFDSTTPTALGRQPTGTPFGTPGTAYTLQFNADGSVQPLASGGSYVRLVVATGSTANNLPQFNNAGAVKGVLVRSSGAITFVNKADYF